MENVSIPDVIERIQIILKHDGCKKTKGEIKKFLENTFPIEMNKKIISIEDAKNLYKAAWEEYN